MQLTQWPHILPSIFVCSMWYFMKYFTRLCLGAVRKEKMTVTKLTDSTEEKRLKRNTKYRDKYQEEGKYSLI